MPPSQIVPAPDLNGERLADVPLVAMEAVEQAGLIARLWDSIKLFLIGLFGFN